MKVIVTLPLFAFSIIVGFAQTPEWVEYCRLKKTTQSELVTSDTIYKTYCVMDSIYNGIPLFTDLFQFLKAAIACDEQEKIKELAIFVSCLEPASYCLQPRCCFAPVCLRASAWWACTSLRKG